MIVALDATPLTVATGGIRRYTEELVQALRSEFPEDRWHLISDQLPPLPSGPLMRRWWLWGVQRRMSQLRVELFHGTDFAVPYLPLRPSVMTVHDLSPWREREWHAEAARVRRRTPLLIGLGLATMIITPTHAVRAELIDRFNVHPARVVAVPEAAADCFRPRTVSARGKPYLLYAGTLEPRKNIELVVERWRTVRRQHDIRLILAGRVRDDFAAPAGEPDLELRGVVTDEELAVLYSNAAAVLYPSLYEGFGLPVLEAMQCGAPVLIGDDPAVREVAGRAAMHISELENLLGDVRLHTERRRLSLARSAEFSWARSARMTREVYVEAFRRF
jgi:glycosyltransferase involved in cell wall biosynthesis